MNTPQTLVDAVRLEVQGGSGLVARLPGLVLVLPDVNDDSRAAERLVSLCTDEGAPRGADLLRRVAYLIGEPELAPMPGFCLLVGDMSVTRLLAHGEVEILLPDGQILSAVPYITWIEKSLEELNGLTVTAPDRRAPGMLMYQRVGLRHGVVPGGGARFLPPLEVAQVNSGGPNEALAAPLPPEPPSSEMLAGSPAPLVPPGPAQAPPPEGSTHLQIPPAPHRSLSAPEPVVDGQEETKPLGAPSVQREVSLDPAQPSFEAVLLTGEVGDPVEPPSVPLPVANGIRDHGGQVLVSGIVCSRGHFNDPGSAYCGFCGISMVQRTHEFVSAPRPTLGVLIFDDGAAFTVDGDYVVGREPELDPAVATGKARPLTLIDEDSTISRVHAALRLEDWRTLIEDRGSANGTFVSRSDTGDGWLRLSAGQPTVLTPGQRIRFGLRVAVFESHVRHG